LHVTLDQLLSSLTIEQLQDLAAVWSPDEAIANSKLELYRALRSMMTRPDRAEHCLDAAGSFGRGIVRNLLRSEGVSQTAAVLAASSSARPKSMQETREAISDLAALGLVVIEQEKRWETYGAAVVTIADELIDPLRIATGIDDRAWPEILSLASYLGVLPQEALAERLGPLGLTCDVDTPIDDVLPALTSADACRERLGRLSEPVRDAVLAALDGHAGILPVEQLADADLEAYRAELEANLTGTVGDVSLLEYGIDLDGKVLAVFGEVAEALLTAPCDAKIDVADPVGPDFALDLSELIACVRESGAKIKASGALTAAASDRITAKLNRPSLPLMEARDLLTLRLACADKLGLAGHGDGVLEVKQPAWEWEQRSYADKAADLFGLVGIALPTPRSKHHHDGLCTAARDLLRSMPLGEWRRGGSLEGVALRRYLSRIETEGLRHRIADAVNQVAEFVLPPFPGLRQLADDVRGAVTMEAYAMGLLDLAVENGRSVGERLSEFGAVATGRGPTQTEPGKLIATADFEVIVLPEGDTTQLRYEVGQFAAREKFEQTYHLRITKERVEEAVVRGLTVEEMIATLDAHADTGSTPQNVAASIRGWSERVRVATTEHVVVLELPDADLLSVVVEMPEIKKLTVRRVSPTALALSAWPSDRRLLAALRRLGIHVR
jgi:XPB/Ssl2-like helicase family protein